MQKFFILKIGGSVATHKDNTDYTIREDTLRGIFGEIKKCLDYERFKLIIVHGAGGHVHHLAHQHQLKEGTLDDSTKNKGALETQTAVARLHADIMTIGKESSLSLTSFPTHTVITQHNKKINTCELSGITQSLAQQEIPVLYGDMVNDTDVGMSICSGDAITAHLATLLPITHGLFATDVNGIYTSDPHTNPEATLVENVTFSGIAQNVTLSNSHNKDTTGGLAGKIKECTDLFNTSVALQEIHIFNGLHSSNLEKVLQDTPFTHTCITS